MFNRLTRPFGRKSSKAPGDRLHLSYVLKAVPMDPQEQRVVEEHNRLFPRDELSVRGGQKEIVGFADARGVERGVVGPMPMPIPGDEARIAFGYSVSNLGKTSPELPAHGAHFIVASRADPKDRIAALVRHTRLVASVAKAHDAVAIYDGSSRVAHPAAFYVELAASTDEPFMLWTGISIAGEEGGRVGFLTLGLDRFGLPEILVSAEADDRQAGLEYALNLFAYVLARGEQIPDGDTVGRTSAERWKARYVPSPVQPDRSVLRIEMI